MRDEPTSSLPWLKAAACAQPPPAFRMLRSAQKIRHFAPSASLGCGEPCHLRVQFREAHQTTLWCIRCMDAITLYISYFLYVYISYFIDILL